jgi:hypothetical protein
MNRTFLFVIAMAVMLSSCSTGQSYIEGPKEDTGVIGDIGQLPDSLKLRDLGEGLVKYMLEFNFKSGIKDQINPLDEKTTNYIIDNQSLPGTPQFNPDQIAPGQVEIVYSNGSIGMFDLVKGSFANFELSPNLIPPAEMSYSGEKRPMTPQMAEKIAKLWFGQLNIDLSNYEARPINVAEPTSVVFMEKLADNDVTSPNYVKALVSYWGMIVTFEIHIGPTPKIGTKPEFDADAIMEKAKKFLGVQEDFKLDVTPIRIIKRKYFEDKNILKYTDRLAWFVDASGYNLQSRNTILVLDAHTGLPLE